MMFPLSAYIEAALELARYDKLEDGSFAGEIPKLKGVGGHCANAKTNCAPRWKTGFSSGSNSLTDFPYSPALT